MNYKAKAAVERLQRRAEAYETTSDEDAILTHIDGEQARQAARVAAERARVVAWLRAEAAMIGEAGGGERLRLLAFTFERVEHVPEGV